MLQQPTDAIRRFIGHRPSDLFAHGIGACEPPIQKTGTSRSRLDRQSRETRRFKKARPKSSRPTRSRPETNRKSELSTSELRSSTGSWQAAPTGYDSDSLGLYVQQALQTPLLTKEQEIRLAQKISRYRQAFQRLIVQEPQVIEHLTKLLVQWNAKKIRLDAVCNLALSETAKRKKLEPRIRSSLKTLRRLPKQIKSASSSQDRRKVQRETVKLVEELMIRPQPFENAPFKNPNARRLLDEYRRLCQFMTRANLRLVVSVAKKLCGTSPMLMDMIQEGNQGLMHAVTKFDHRRKVRFSTYATPWIKQSIFAALPNAERNIRIPENFGSLVRKLQRRMQDTCEHESGGHNLDSGRNIFRWSNELELPPVDVNRMICIQRDTCSLNQTNPAQSRDGSAAKACLADLIVDHRKANPLLTAQELERKEFIQILMDQSLNEREHTVISLRFGFTDGKDRSLAEVGRKMGITRERVRQVEKQAMEKLSRMSIPLEFV